MHATLRHHAQSLLINTIEQLTARIVERRTHHRTYIRIDTLRPRESKRRMRSLLRRRIRHRQHTPKQLSVVTHLHPPIPLERTHANTKLLDPLEARGNVREVRRAARRRIRQPLRHPRNRIERLSSQRTRGRRLEIRSTVANAERLRPRRITKEAHNSEQLRRIGLAHANAPDRLTP